MNKNIASKIYLGIVSDTNRFMFNNSTGKTFLSVARMIDEYHLEIDSLYEPLYLRPLNEVRLEGFIGLNLSITENGVAYIKLTKEILENFKVDAAAPGNMINNFNYIDEVLIGHFTHCNCNCIYCYTEKDKNFFNNNKTYTTMI